MNKTINVIELFAGVGGFRVGLEKASPLFKTVFANQWEPSKKKQIAWEIYEENFGKGSCLNKNISEVQSSDIPEFDLLTAGFPCQDYSVAKTLKNSLGMEGKKGVLWWELHRIIKEKSPPYLLLENVDRLISSPAKQRGRDFAIILNCLNSLNYSVEWMVINAADYGMPQKRKRVFIYATKNLNKKNILEKAFPFSNKEKISVFSISEDIFKISDDFGKNENKNTFLNYGTAENFVVNTKKIVATPNNLKKTVLKDIILPIDKIPNSYFIDSKDVDKWKHFKLGRKIERKTKEGHSYIYSEGKMSFPDSLNSPARTIITGEGGSTPSRFKHVIEQEGRLRRLTPIELERIQMFPDNHTQSASDIQRAFLMGNALVTGVVEQFGKTFLENN